MRTARRSAETGAPSTRAHREVEIGTSGLRPDPVASVLAMVAASPLGIAITSGRDFEVIYANPQCRLLLGASSDVVSGQPFEELFPSPHAKRCLTLLRRVYEKGHEMRDVRMVLSGRRGGRRGAHAGGRLKMARLWRLTAWPLAKSDPHTVGRQLVLCVQDSTAMEQRFQESRVLVDGMRDLNERLLLTALREQEQTERARAVSENMSTFLATMSHELRTPLTAILGYQALLAEGLSGPVTATQARQLDRIKTSAEHLLAVVNGILSFARIDAGREKVRRSLVDVTTLLEEAMALVLPLASAKGLLFKLDPPEPEFVMDTDRDKVRQILVNLAANAIKFTERGEVSLCAQTVGSGFAEFVVCDTGMGIEQEYLGRIFDPFWRAGDIQGGGAGGTGLGLSVSQRLAHLLGGELTVRSTKGEGSEFTLRLPLRAPGSRRV
ncbi:MAG TPA: PAS domain-containing sensor histidine kinase [Gemmatimonadaceae bacterium]|nr:PAS domain-containing sensor histidine kinase [Gemmatimonadaceae bacterium]